MALAVLSGGSPRELVMAIAGGDAARFQAVPGIGKRTAERIIVELREKAADEQWAGAFGGEEDGPLAPGEVPLRTPIVARRGEEQHPRTLAREGLVELGYSPGEAEDLLRELEGQTPEELIAGALRLARSAG